MNDGNVWNTARDQDIHCTDFFVFDFTSNVKRSKWVKWRLRVHIARWLIFLKTSCKGIVYLYVFRISFLLVACNCVKKPEKKNLSYEATDVSGFIAQLVEHRTGIVRSRVQTPLKSWIFSGFFTQLHKLRSLPRSVLHFFRNEKISQNDIYFFFISSRMVLCMQLNFLTDRDVISLM